MSDLVFVDTNVFVYARDATEPEKGKQAGVWLRALWESRRGRVGFQVLNEYYVTVTQKLKPGMSLEDARADVRNLAAWRPIGIDLRVTEGAFQLQDEYALSWWDALIVSAAQVMNCRLLLTEDLQDQQALGEVVVVNPFRHGVQDVLSI